MAKTKGTAPATPAILRGSGGELHQTASDPNARLTTNHGVPIGDNQNSLKGGSRGPTLLEDFVLREKIQHFAHERIPERIVAGHRRFRGPAAAGPPSKARVRRSKSWRPRSAASR